MDLLDRLHGRLLAALAGDPERPGHTEFTVADLYQRLIPYRAVRSDLGVMELAEYEHLLLRLLAGERNYLKIADGEVETELHRELASLNPILGIYRDFGEAAVSLGRGRRKPGDGGNVAPATPAPTATTDPSRVAPGPEATPEPPVESRPDAEARQPPPTVPRPLPAPAVRHDRSVRAAPAALDPPRTACGACGHPLPLLSQLRYCPHCGTRHELPPCRRCGEPLDSSWRFCIRCGAGRDR